MPSSNAARVPIGAMRPGVDPNAGRRRAVDSASLFEGARELVITHHGESYCLRVTRNEKLILTK